MYMVQKNWSRVSTQSIKPTQRQARPRLTAGTERAQCEDLKPYLTGEVARSKKEHVPGRHRNACG